MDLNDYQKQALGTDTTLRVDSRPGDDLIIPLLGLAGETGELLSEYKKHLRDGVAHILFPDRVKEELGDILWYVSNIATKFGLTLDQIASENLKKTRDRWGTGGALLLPFRESGADGECFPRQFVVELLEIEVEGKKKIRGFVDGVPFGDDLTDNAYDPDGYRFHDVFHLGFVAVLGWSPVIRKLMKRKRKSNTETDEVEDGGRAQVVDESISALVFEYARDHAWLEGVSSLDYLLLRTIKGLTAHLEVRDRTIREWQDAIFLGFEVWRKVRAENGGKIEVNLDSRSLNFISSR